MSHIDVLPLFRSTGQSHIKDKWKERFTCNKSCTKADLSTEGRGPVCRVPIPTLTHFLLVISTTIPVAVRYRHSNPGTVSICFNINSTFIPNNNVEGSFDIVVCLSQSKTTHNKRLPVKGIDLKKVCEPLWKLELSNRLTWVTSSRTRLEWFRNINLIPYRAAYNKLNPQIVYPKDWLTHSWQPDCEILIA